MQPTKVNYLNTIRDHFAEITYTNSTLITYGWDHNVVNLDDSLVFRFPKRKKQVPRFKAEVKLLEHLAPQMPVPVPEYVYTPDDLSFGGYNLLSGTEMLPEIFNDLEENKRKAIAKQIGAFLSVLHSTPINLTKEAGFQEESGGYWWSQHHKRETLEKLKEKVFPKLSREDVEWVEHQFQEYLALSFSFDLTVIHSDLTADHILIDPVQGGVTGIIDFGDIEFSDPAIDFSGLWAYGNDFPEQTLSHYTGKVSNNFLERSKFPELVRYAEYMLKLEQGEKLPVSVSFEEFHESLTKVMASGLTL